MNDVSPGFELLVVEGPESALRGCVAGWGAGEGRSTEDVARTVLRCEDFGVLTESPLEKVVEVLRPGHVSHLLVRQDAAEAFLRALLSHGGGLKVRGRRRVLGARFEFQYEIFSRPEGEAVLALFEALPAGVTLSPDYRPEASADADAEGVEMYAPVHHYVLRARGTARGPLPGILAMHERMRKHERIRARDVLLDLAPEGEP